MKRTWLVLDVTGLCHRAMHTTGALKYKGVGPTGVLFGFFAAVLDYQREFQTSHFVFCFDRRGSVRAKLFPDYKLKRRTKTYTEEEQKLYAAMHKQIVALRRVYLPQIGYKNVFSQKGYEADDIIASVCQNLPKGDEAIVISSDEDMYQLLSKRVRIWKPVAKQMWSKRRFKNVYGIRPSDWSTVKALAGCGTDEVPGIRGIGEKTACQFICGTLKEGSAKHTLIIENQKKTLKRNLPLVKLPFEGTKDFVPQVDGRLGGWKEVFRELGFKSLNPY